MQNSVHTDIISSDESEKQNIEPELGLSIINNPDPEPNIQNIEIDADTEFPDLPQEKQGRKRGREEMESNTKIEQDQPPPKRQRFKLLRRRIKLFLKRL